MATTTQRKLERVVREGNQSLRITRLTERDGSVFFIGHAFTGAPGGKGDWKGRSLFTTSDRKRASSAVTEWRKSARTQNEKRKAAGSKAADSRARRIVNAHPAFYSDVEVARARKRLGQ